MVVGGSIIFNRGLNRAYYSPPFSSCVAFSKQANHSTLTLGRANPGKHSLQSVQHDKLLASTVARIQISPSRAFGKGTIQ